MGYRLEQHTERLSVFLSCGNRTRCLLLFAVCVVVVAVALAVEHTAHFLHCYPSASFAILLGLLQQPFHLTNVVPSTKPVSESSKSRARQVSKRKQVANQILTVLQQPAVNVRVAIEI